MNQVNSVLESINETQRSSIQSIADHFLTALLLAEEMYSIIPPGKWKKFFDETMNFGIGLNTKNSFVFVDQAEKRIRFLKDDEFGKVVSKKLIQRNFNLLIEALLYPFYENPVSTIEAVGHKICVEVPQSFSFTKEEFTELQEALRGYLKITTKLGDSSDRDNQQGEVAFFEFSFCIEK